MKRWFMLALAVMAALSLGAAAQTLPAGDPYGLVVSLVEIVEAEGMPYLNVHMENHGEKAIKSFIIEASMLGEDGLPMLAYEATMDGFTKEMRLGSLTGLLGYATPLAPGHTGLASEPIPEKLRASTLARAAITYYQYEDGQEVYLGEAAFSWVGSDGQTLAPLDLTQSHQPIDKATWELASTVPLGMLTDSRPLYTYLAGAYGLQNGGSWVWEVGTGSRGEKAGFKAGDLVVTIDGIPFTQNPLAFDLAKAKLAQGQDIDLQVERGGELLELTVKAE